MEHAQISATDPSSKPVSTIMSIPDDLLLSSMNDEQRSANNPSSNTVDRYVSAATTIKDLPDGVMLRVFSLLPNSNFGTVTQVCKKWSALVDVSELQIWKARFEAIGILPVDKQTGLGRSIAW